MYMQMNGATHQRESCPDPQNLHSVRHASEQTSGGSCAHLQTVRVCEQFSVTM